MWVSAVAVVGAFAALALAERRRPLRQGKHEPKPRREIRNLALAAISAAAMQAVERPVTSRATRFVHRRRFGLVPALNLRSPLDTILECLLLDYTLYLWHVLTHRVPLLWRFHRVHHADLDMDASTGVRFHFGEMTISILWRTVQILLIGVSRRALSIWNTVLLIEVMFHHSNLRLPQGLERWLSKLLVTPRMHGTHHSVVEEEMNSNWSSGLSVWDWLHGTLRRDVPQERLTIGLEQLRRPEQVTLPKLVTMPFEPKRSSPVGDPLDVALRRSADLLRA